MRAKKYFIGISLGFNSAAACCDDKGQLIAAISEERLIREKNTKHIPINALSHVYPGHDAEIEPVLTYSHYDYLDKAYFTKYEPLYLWDDRLDADGNLLKFVNSKCIGYHFERVHRVEHHTAHAYSVFPYYKVPKNSLILTSDGYGDGASQTIRHVSDMYHPWISGWYGTKDSLALVYQFVTGALGLKMHQHEGKVTGLAAYGDIAQARMLLDSLYAQYSNTMYRWDYKCKSFQELQRDIFAFCNQWLGRTIEQMGPLSIEDTKVTALCKMAQLFVEQEMVKRLSSISSHKKYHLFLAGGLFANVKLNTLISSSSDFLSVNVAPPMGDEGTAVGAALARFAPKKIAKGCFNNVFSGVNMTDSSPHVSCDEREFMYKTHITTFYDEKDLIKLMAKMLAEGEIIHYRSGVSEFGPRALCHSTTFYQPNNPDGTKYLNRTLGRSEYMPYAPIILDKDVDKIFIRNKKLDKTNQYMTAVLLVKPDIDVLKDYAGAVHVDRTARPQILYDKKSFAYKLLTEYKRLTGRLMLINTSWNIHNNPTVALVDDSKLTWMQSGFCGAALVHDKTMYVKKGENHEDSLPV